MERPVLRIDASARSVKGAVIVMALAGTAGVALAQTGFSPSPQAAFIVVFVLPALAISGLVICGVGYFFYRKLWVFVLGCAMMAPAVAFMVSILPQLIREMVPKKKLWDFSADRSVSKLREKKTPVEGIYYYQDNILSTVRLPGNRQWSGKASLVVLGSSGDEIISINWQGRSVSLEEVTLEAKRILAELGFRTHDIDGWYDKVRRGEEDYFSIRDEVSNPEVHVSVRDYQEKKKWAVVVGVSWKEAGR